MIHLSAAQLGAPHKRDRIWILARRSPDPDSGRCKEQRVAQHGDVAGPQGDQPDRLGASGRWPREDASADALQLSFWDFEQRKARRRDEIQDGRQTEFRDAGLTKWWQAEPEVGRVVDGFPGRVGELRGLGNAQVPIVGAVAFKILMDRLNAIR